MRTRIVVSLIGILALLLVLFFLPLWCFAVVVAFFAAVGAYELMRCAGARTPKAVTLIVMIIAAYTPLWYYFMEGGGQFSLSLWSGLFLIPAAIHVAAVQKNLGRYKITGPFLCAVLAAVIFPQMLSALIICPFLHTGYFYGAGPDVYKYVTLEYLLLPILISFACDSGAYFLGLLLGRHKLASVVSPNKTVEGAVGGLLFSLLISLLYGYILSTMGRVIYWANLTVYSIIGGAACQLGDLFYSSVKREFGVKDYGKLFPGHGGVLDRLDGMSFTAPVIALLMGLYPAFLPLGAIW